MSKPKRQKSDLRPWSRSQKPRVACLLLGEEDGGTWLGLSDGSAERLALGHSARSPQESDENHAPRSSAFLERIHSIGVREGGLVLGLPTAWVFSVSLPPLPTSAKSRLRSRFSHASALRFQAEPLLPVDCEAFAIAFDVGSPAPEENLASSEALAKGREPRSSRSVFLIATHAARAGSEMLALEDAGIPVAAVCATSLLAAMGGNAQEKQQLGTIELRSFRHLERVSVAGGRFRGWSATPCGPTMSPLQLDAPEKKHDSIHLAAQSVAHFRDRVPMDLSRGPLGIRSVAVSVPLRRGLFSKPETRELRTPLLVGIAAAALLVASLVISMQLHVAKLKKRTGERDREAAAAFLQTFPDQPVPKALLSRLQSEAQAAGVLTGPAQEPERRGPQRASALQALEGTLKSVPDNLRIALDEIWVEPERLLLEGRVRSPGDADRLAANIANGNLEFVPQNPRTQALSAERGAVFTLVLNRTSRQNSETRAGQ